MSNRRRLPGTRQPAVHCASCGRSAGKARQQVRLPDGRTVCASCRDNGLLARRMACGCYAMPGNTVVRTGDGFVCARHAADTFEMAKGKP